jgi:hypothetical protein
MGMFGRGKARTPEQQAEITRLMGLINQNPKQEETIMAKNTAAVQETTTVEETAATKTAVVVEVKEATPAPVVEVTLVKPVVAVVPKAPTKSDLIRAMFTEGSTVAEIAKATNSHYSFVYGVCKTLKGSSPSESKGPSRSDEIRALADAGATPGEIAKALNANYSFVHSVVKKHRDEQGQV